MLRRKQRCNTKGATEQTEVQHERCFGTERAVTVKTLRNIQRCTTKGASEQIELLHLVPNGINRAATFGFYRNKKSCSSIHLKPYESVAPLFVQQHLSCCSSICSKIPLVLHLYLLRSIINVALLSIPKHINSFPQHFGNLWERVFRKQNPDSTL